MTDDQIDGGQEVEEAPESEAQEAPPTPSYTEEDAEQARAFGWKSPDEWVGERPASYIDHPVRYLERVQKMPFFAKMQERMDAQDRAHAETVQRIEAESQRRARESRAFYDQRMAQITARQRAAAAEADTATYDQLEREKRQMAQQAQPQQQAPQVDPYVQQYMGKPEGAWLANPILQQHGAALIEANPAIKAQPAAQQVAYAEGELRKLFPGAFAAPEPAQQQPAQRAPARVEGGGLAGGIGRAGAFDKLPADARAQFKREVEDGVFTDDAKGREAYAREYLKYA